MRELRPGTRVVLPAVEKWGVVLESLTAADANGPMFIDMGAVRVRFDDGRTSHEPIDALLDEVEWNNRKGKKLK